MLDAPVDVWPKICQKEEYMKPNSMFQAQHNAQLYLLAVAALLLVLLAACGGGSSANANPATTSTATANTPSATTPTTITDTPTTSIATPTPAPQPKPAKGSTQVVLILNDSNGAFVFSPASLTITPGTTVIWKNMSSAPHTITSDDGQTFDSGTIAPGGTYKFKFTSPGTFSYHCNYHPYMKATINL